MTVEPSIYAYVNTLAVSEPFGWIKSVRRRTKCYLSDRLVALRYTADFFHPMRYNRLYFLSTKSRRPSEAEPDIR